MGWGINSIISISRFYLFLEEEVILGVVFLVYFYLFEKVFRRKVFFRGGVKIFSYFRVNLLVGKVVEVV